MMNEAGTYLDGRARKRLHQKPGQLLIEVQGFDGKSRVQKLGGVKTATRESGGSEARQRPVSGIQNAGGSSSAKKATAMSFEIGDRGRRVWGGGYALPRHVLPVCRTTYVRRFPRNVTSEEAASIHLAATSTSTQYNAGRIRIGEKRLSSPDWASSDNSHVK